MRSTKKSRKLGSQLPRQEMPPPRRASSSAPVAVADGAPEEGPEQGWAPLPSPPSTACGSVVTVPSNSGAGFSVLSTRTLTTAPPAGVAVTVASATVTASSESPRLKRRGTACRG